MNHIIKFSVTFYKTTLLYLKKKNNIKNIFSRILWKKKQLNCMYKLEDNTWLIDILKCSNIIEKYHFEY